MTAPSATGEMSHRRREFEREGPWETQLGGRRGGGGRHRGPRGQRPLHPEGGMRMH